MDDEHAAATGSRGGVEDGFAIAKSQNTTGVKSDAATAASRKSRAASAPDSVTHTLPYPAKVHVFVNLPHPISCTYMKKIHKEGEETAENLEGSALKKLLVFAAVGLKLGRTILAKLQSVEDSVEIIAREIARQSEQRE